MSESEEKKLAKRIWGRCYMRLQRELNRKPTKDEMQDCIKTELYKEEHGLIKEKRGRKSSQEDFFTTMGEPESTSMPKIDKGISDEQFRRILRHKEDLETREELAILGRINRGLDWSDEEPKSREESMKELSEKLNARIIENTDKNICSRCLSSICRCPCPTCGNYPCICNY